MQGANSRRDGLKKKPIRPTLEGRVLWTRQRRIEPLVSTIARETVALPFPPVRESVESQPGVLVQTVLRCLEDAKAEEIVCIDLNGKTALADTMIIATGRSNTHVGAAAERIIKALKELGVAAPRVEGLSHCDWVLVDAGDAIVHLFRPEVRQFYNLEKMWGHDRPSEGKAG
jgi:ribosome-associated protein